MIMRIIVFTLLAIVGIAFLLLLLANIYPTFGQTVSCRLYQSITGIVPTSQETRPTLPWYCYPSECRFVRATVKAETPEELAETVAFHAYRCWRCAEMGSAPRDVMCSELYSELSTDEVAVTQELQDNNHCNELPNSEMEFSETGGCGNANKIYFNSQRLSGTIVIKYDSYSHRIMVS